MLASCSALTPVNAPDANASSLKLCPAYSNRTCVPSLAQANNTTHHWLDKEKKKKNYTVRRELVDLEAARGCCPKTTAQIGLI